MYSTCLFCAASLGANDVIEAFPVGRRLAFDAAKGRLWVVCRKCERWNLTPLEERWEAVEAAERLFRETRLRVSTDNVGLARLKEGLELVRIGPALRPELAAWRYGDQFGRRRRRHYMVGGAVAATGAAVLVAGPVMGLVSLGAVSPLINLLNTANLLYHNRRLASVPTGDGPPLKVRSVKLRETRLVPRGDAGWMLEVPGVVEQDRPTLLFRPTDDATRHLTGEAAVRAAGAILPRLNRAGGAPARVREAVGMLEEAGDPARLFGAVAAETRRRYRVRAWQFAEEGTLRTIPAAARLALEMAAHEESERRAMEGELAQLEAMWREAEEIAGIADSL